MTGGKPPEVGRRLARRSSTTSPDVGVSPPPSSTQGPCPTRSARQSRHSSPSAVREPSRSWSTRGRTTLSHAWLPKALSRFGTLSWHAVQRGARPEANR
jgi:hypothetical protein